MNIFNLILLSLCICVCITFIIQKYIFETFERKNTTNMNENDINDIIDLSIENEFITLGTILITDAVIGNNKYIFYIFHMIYYMFYYRYI
jgi:hypothetical protein